MSEIPSALLPTPAAPQATQAAAAPSPYTVPLLQNDTDTVIPVDQDHADVAIRSGLYSPKKDAEFIVLDKFGNRNVVQGEHVRDALNQGMRLENLNERHERELQENYGGASGIGQALGAGAARGASFGLSDLAASASPQTAQHLANLEEANPISSAVGEVGGFLAGSLVGSTEAGAGAKLAGAAVKGVDALGASAGRLVERAITKEGAKAGLSSKVISSIASKMAQEATIGSVVGAGNLISESALGKADFNAENLAASVGMGAVIGGSFGASLGAAEALAPLARKGMESVGNLASDFTSPEKAALEISGYTPAKAAKLGEKNAQMVRDLPDFYKNEVGLSVGDTDASQVVSKVESLKKKAGQGIGDKIKAYDELIGSDPSLQIKGKELYKDLASELDDKFLQSASGSPESRAKLKQAGNYYDELIKSAQEDRTITLKGLQEARANAYELGYSSTGAPVETLEGQMARYAGRFYSDALKDAAQKVSKRTGDTELYAQFIKDHKNYSYSSELLPKLKMKAAKSESLNPLVISVMGAAGGAMTSDDVAKGASIGALMGLGARSFLRSDLRRNLVVLGKIEKAQQRVTQMTERAAKGLVAPAVKTAVRAVPISIIDSEFAKKYVDGKYKKPADAAEAFVNMHDNFARYQQNPEMFMQRVNRTTASMYKSAPDTSMALDSLSVAAATFLGSKMPKRHSAPGMLEVFNKPRPPSKLDLANFERYLTAVEHPESVFKDAEHGKLSHQGVEALKNVYPNLYQKLRDKTLEHVMKTPKMPFNSKMQLGLLLDIPTHESLMPENVLGLQANFSKPDDAQGGAVKPSQAGLKELGASKRAETDTQKTLET